jgi:hypothetical protein
MYASQSDMELGIMSPVWTQWFYELLNTSQSYQFNYVMEVSAGTFTNNSPSAGYVAWDKIKIKYNGQVYSVSTNGNTNKKYLYWEPATFRTIQSSDTFPVISQYTILVGVNDAGVFTDATSSGYSRAVAGLNADGTVADGKVLPASCNIPYLSSIAADIGTITAGSVTGVTVQTEATAARGLKMTSTGLKGYDGSGNETLSYTASNGNIALKGTLTALPGSVLIAEITPPASPHFALYADDTNWHTIDFSSIIPTGYSAILARIITWAADGACQFEINKYGVTNTNTSGKYYASPGFVWPYDAIIPIDSSRRATYRASIVRGHYTGMEITAASLFL